MGLRGAGLSPPPEPGPPHHARLHLHSDRHESGPLPGRSPPSAHVGLHVLQPVARRAGLGTGRGSEPTHDDHPPLGGRRQPGGSAVCARLGRAELQSLSKRVILHQHSGTGAGHRSALRHARPTLLGVPNQAGLGQREQHRWASARSQTQGPAPHPRDRSDLLGLLPPLLDLAAAASVPTRHAADGPCGDAGDGESDPDGADLWELLREPLLLYFIDWKTETQQADADVGKSALPQEQSTAVEEAATRLREVLCVNTT